MAQDMMMINGVVVKQPEKDLGYDFETTYSEDSGRVQTGTLHITPLFTVESFSYTASGLTQEEMSLILQMVAKGDVFNLHYRSPYYGKWRDDEFHVAKGSLSIGSWEKDKERYTSLSFNMVGVNPI